MTKKKKSAINILITHWGLYPIKQRNIAAFLNHKVNQYCFFSNKPYIKLFFLFYQQIYIYSTYDKTEGITHLEHKGNIGKYSYHALIPFVVLIFDDPNFATSNCER